MSQQASRPVWYATSLLTRRRLHTNTVQGFEALKQLLAESQPYRFILGVRNTASTDEALKAVDFDRKANPVTLLPLDLTDVKGTKTFAQRVLQDLDTTGIDYLLLNAALIKNASEATPYGGKWCESMVVNHVGM